MAVAVEAAVVEAAVHEAEAAGASATGGVGSGGAWNDWWDRGHDYLSDMSDWFDRVGRGDRDGYVDRIGHGFRDFDDHLRRMNRGWDGWDDRRYGSTFDGWNRRWSGMRNRWMGRDWSRGNWQNHATPFRSMMTEFNGFYNDWNTMRDGRYR